MPKPGFPRSIPEFYAMFPDEDAAVRFVFESRWPSGWTCPRCSADRCYRRSDRREAECAGCGYVCSVTAGTVMHKTRTELRLWLLAAWLLITDKRGVSAKNLQRQLGIKRYETAFQMLHKLRAAAVAPDRSKLDGAVEVDETMVGGVGSPKFIVVGAVEIKTRETTVTKASRGEGRSATRTGPLTREETVILSRPGRVRFRHVTARSEAKLGRFVRDVVEPGAMVITDAASAYSRLDFDGYRHEVESTARGMAAKDVLRFFHLAASNLKTWLAGTFHGSVSGQHLQAYLNEFAFRFNRRDNLHAAFQTLLGVAARVEGPEYDKLYSGEWAHPNPSDRARRLS